MVTPEDFRKLKSITISATTQYIKPNSKYTGPLMRDLLKLANPLPSASSAVLEAADGYLATAPLADFMKWDVVAATAINGESLTLGSKGPVYIMYPNDDYPKDLQNLVTQLKQVWSLSRIVIR